VSVVTFWRVRSPQSFCCSPRRRRAAGAKIEHGRGSTCKSRTRRVSATREHAWRAALLSLHLVVLRKAVQIAVLHLLQIVHLHRRVRVQDEVSKSRILYQARPNVSCESLSSASLSFSRPPPVKRLVAVGGGGTTSKFNNDNQIQVDVAHRCSANANHDYARSTVENL